ncbi:MAG: epoxyqueuosine reductase QueH [Bacillota bacterium]
MAKPGAHDGNRKLLLLHVCCGPCAIHPLERLRAQGFEPHGYFFNPNIHPYAEYLRRQETLAGFAREEGWPVIFAPDYPLEQYFREVAYREGDRCRFCFTQRLRQTARFAVRDRFAAFSTTLLVSPRQKHDLIREAGAAAAAEYGIPFYYEDFRPGFRKAAARSREIGLYRQQYCGCVFSERERHERRSKGERG